MADPKPHPDCVCQQRPLNQDDLTQMYAAGKYEQINAAFNAGRFQFNDQDQ